ncbi:MAG TPA: hypothetical protein VJ767_06385 [Nitrososphaeraceae archaeon]|nr:hypothetical protein [Nitrososphaeraceae archaeon]
MTDIKEHQNMSSHSFGECLLPLGDPCKMYLYPQWFEPSFPAFSSWFHYILMISHILQFILDIEFITFSKTTKVSIGVSSELHFTYYKLYS